MLRKSKTKKLYLLLMTIGMLLLAACGGSNTTDNDSTESEAQTDATNESESFEMKASFFAPAQHGHNVHFLTPFLEELEEATEGRVTSTVYTGSALGAPPEQYDMAATGVADLAHAVHGYTPGKFIVTQFTQLPFIADFNDVSGERLTNITWDLYDEFPQMEEEYDGTIPLAVYNGDPTVILLRDKEVNSIEDLKGLKLRSPSDVGNQMIEALGAVPVSMPMPDVYESMQKGVIDGTLAPISTFPDEMLNEVTKYVVDARINGTTFMLPMNEKTYNRFSGNDLDALNSMIGRELSLKGARIYDESAKKGWEMAEEQGIKVKRLSDEEVAEWQEVLKPVSDKWIKDAEAIGLPGQEIYDFVIQRGK